MSNMEEVASMLSLLINLNLFNLKFLKMIREIISFYNHAPSLLQNNIEEETLR